MKHFEKTRSARIAIAAFAALIAAPVVAEAGPLTLQISGARNANGVVRCGLYASADGFREPGREMSEAAGKINGDRATCSFKSVPDGTYAVAVFHAEQNERKMDIGMFGKPKQGVGFSRNPSITFGPPKFEAAAFSVGAAPVSLNIKLSY
ncbi:MAG TPA: DUF2141 domain-containing protein [Xanthobacteraceae bacterium]|nr:DUF2141 domain-containing protein [Xanthobacteraceae bacterium]